MYHAMLVVLTVLAGVIWLAATLYAASLGRQADEEDLVRATLLTRYGV